MKSDSKSDSSGGDMGDRRVSIGDDDRRDRDRDRDSRDHRDSGGGLGGRRRGDDRGSDGDASGGEESSVCRDFLRSNCRRGRRCRYIHPEGKEGEEADNGSRQFVFCRDYQNSTCRRAGCRFVHCSREDEATYRMTGMLPPHVLEAAIMQGKTGGLPTLSRPGEAPVCRDYLKGECRRGPQACRFRHLSVREYQEELGYVSQVAAASSPAAAAMVAAAMQQQQQQQQQASTLHHQASATGTAGAGNGTAAAAAAAAAAAGSVSAMQGAVAAHPSTMAAMSAAAAAAAAAHHPALTAYHHLGQPPPPPPWQVGAVGDIANGTAQHYAAVAPEQYLRFDFPPPMQQPPPPPPSLCVGYEPEPKRSRMDHAGTAAAGGEAARIYVLEEENAMLHKKLDDLKKQVQDLTATNEFLLDQNAQLRMASKRQVVPAVSMTSSVPGAGPTLQDRSGKPTSHL